MPSNKSQYKDVLDYIDTYWNTVAFKSTDKVKAGWRNRLLRAGTVSLPHTAFAPNHTYFAGTQFYWDSYFTVLGLIDSGQGTMACGMVDNLCALHKQFGLVLARNTRLSKGRTQPPFLTRMAWEVFESGAADQAWMDSVLQTAVSEYEKVWHGGGRFLKDTGLSRYHPQHMPHFLTTYESGWDTSSRFSSHALSVAPVDLAALLYQYEDDLLNWAEQHKPEDVAVWQERLDRRRALITEYFWDDETGFFYDYDFKTQKRRPLRTLAGFFPLWAGAASQQQADRCLKQLPIFEHEFGLASTEKIAWKGHQWDYPNGWPPLQYIVIHALRSYGFNEDAARLTKRWLYLNQLIFKQTGQLWEKYDVVQGEIGRRGRVYPTLPGFTWANAVFLRLLKDQNDL
jgi:alpha,alpha-trehalase